MNWFMPALVNSSVGSFAGISELEATRVWPFSSKKRRKDSRMSALFIIPLPETGRPAERREHVAICAAWRGCPEKSAQSGKEPHYIGIRAHYALTAPLIFTMATIDFDPPQGQPVQQRSVTGRPAPAQPVSETALTSVPARSLSRSADSAATTSVPAATLAGAEIMRQFSRPRLETR